MRTHSAQTMDEFLAQLRTWAIDKTATPAFIDKIDELINDYSGGIEERIAAEINEHHNKTIEELELEIETNKEQIEELKRALAEATRHKMPWEV